MFGKAGNRATAYKAPRFTARRRQARITGGIIRNCFRSQSGRSPSVERAMKQCTSLIPDGLLAAGLNCSLVLVLLTLALFPDPGCSEEENRLEEETFFTLHNNLNLREFAGTQAGRLLTLGKGRGEKFGVQQRKRYCRLKENPEQIQWVLNDLETGEVISRSDNAETLFFGASASKLFVAAALLDKQKGAFDKSQLNHVVKMIVVSDNFSWKELQRQVGDDGSNDSGREAVDDFVQRMGYGDTKGFQGWLRKKDGTRVHGNELNAMELSEFLYDTYQGNYEGAEVLWKIMHATRTGRRKIDKYTPGHVYIGGKTGTYDGPNASPQTIKHTATRARAMGEKPVRAFISQSPLSLNRVSPVVPRALVVDANGKAEHGFCQGAMESVPAAGQNGDGAATAG